MNIISGGRGGLSATSDQIWYQNQPGIEGVSEVGDVFGAALAVGDFNNDGFDDLAAGVPFESIGNISHAGAVNIIYGGNGGLSATSDQIWYQNKMGIEGVSEWWDFFGSGLAP